MALPQRLTFVTLGAYSVARLREFYRSWGWTEDEGEPDYASFVAGSVRLALYPIDRLRDEAAPGADLPAEGSSGGVTLAINFASRVEVDTAVADAAAAGARVIHPPVDRDWGGYSAYVADPEGHRWELAWAPGITPTEATRPPSTGGTMAAVSRTDQPPSRRRWLLEAMFERTGFAVESADYSDDGFDARYLLRV